MSIKDYYPNISKSRIGRFNVVMIVLSYILQDLRTVQRILLYSQIWGGVLTPTRKTECTTNFGHFIIEQKITRMGLHS